MKIEELERLAVAATARLLEPVPTRMNVPTTVTAFRNLYAKVLAEFIEQEKAERHGDRKKTDI